MILTFNPGKLERQEFFKELINYLWIHDDVTLRKIKSHFTDYSKIDRLLEEYINHGYILRQNKRYSLNLPFLSSLDGLVLDDLVFIDSDSQIYQLLQKRKFVTNLDNPTNHLVIVEETDFERNTLTLSNYFYKLTNGYPLSREQKKLYQLLGDVNSEYALKYMSSFILKFLRKDSVKQKRTVIFIQALELLGYISLNQDTTYRLNAKLDVEALKIYLT
ncbi:hypothetical protein WA64_07830 [Streptococcus agalactiae]|uniref:DUF1803 domain-containing protein n=1 Tax=Streptococcus agalactiae TaxID=1311 RepID=UPI0006402829|nr:DUF1803 domain-containing protein [Streptococcus agalactiae]KLJ66294.1 hypothetical protein WA64_07830 [Streptococcus agalactiae]